MSDKFISSVHVQKLGHRIQEIRERALFNIISKLDNGFAYDNDLARSKETLSRLFDWFSYHPCTYQDVVLKLIERILRSDCGDVLIKHYGLKAIINDLRQIRSNIHPTLYELVDEIIQIAVSSEEVNRDVPPLQSDLPLSYRSQDAVSNIVVESTATPIESFVQGSPNTHHQEVLEHGQDVGNPPLHLIFKWQSLIEPDRDVLESLEQSLRNPSDPMTLLNSCQFFTNVILEDFPAEIFLQRPGILLLFGDYLKSSVSTRCTNAILYSLLKLTKCVTIRIFYYRDPCMHNNKQLISSEPNTPLSFRSSTKQNSDSVLVQDDSYLQSKQLIVPTFCFLVIQSIFDYIYVKPESIRTENQHRRSQIGVNLSLDLFDELINLLSLCLRPSDWEKRLNSVFVDIFNKFEDVLIRFADVLEHFRLESMSNDVNKFDRATHLRLLYICGTILHKLIPLSKSDLVLPRQFKNALSNTLLDSALARLFPKVHQTIFLFVKEFGGHFETDSIEKYRELETVCDSFTAAVKFLKNSKSLSPDVLVKLAKDAVPSIGFHKNLSFIKSFVLLCGTISENVIEIAEYVVLKLLAHSDFEIQEEMYKLCHQRVILTIGPKLNTSGTGVPGSQILFLLQPQILIEICCHGVNSCNKQIKTYADEILIHILKCKLLVSEEIWNRTLAALIPAMPLLVGHADKNSVLSRTFISILDPDTAKTLHLPPIEVVRGNLRMLYVDNYLTREESISRLFWLLATQTNARNLLPQLNSLQDKELDTVCHLPRVADINKQRPLQHFYQDNALIQVLELLNSDLVERDIRRSALTQIGVMIEDPLLHFTFLERNGIQTVIGVIKSALTENDRDYIDCMIPAVSILKNIVLYNPLIRLELSNDLDIYFYILRGLFIFCSDERMRQDCSILLCLLLFSEYILGTPAKSDLSFPHILVDKLLLPFSCNSHWRTSKNSLPQLAATLLSDKWCLSSLQIHWNAQWFGGFKELLKWNKITYANSLEFNKDLRLTDLDLQSLKSSSLDYSIENFLTDIENGTSHNSVIDSVSKLEGYVRLYSASTSEKQLLRFAWEKSFSRFLNTPPAYEEDIALLVAVIKFLNVLVPQYTLEGESCWIIKNLKNSSHCLPNLLQVESSYDLDLTNLHYELLNLLIICVRHEQSYLNLQVPAPSDSESWLHIIQILAEKLKFANTEDFNFAYLGSVLSCLVHLTTALGWSRCKAGKVPEEPIPGLIIGLCELLGAFHSNGARLMGIGITRHVLLLINHLLAELQSVNAKGWEMCFIGESAFEENVLNIFSVLEQSRDVVLRAAILQLLASLAVSPRASTELVREINSKRSVWEVAFSVLLDHNESSIVRENSAALLANLLSHITAESNGKMALTTNLVSSSMQKNEVEAIFLLLEEFKFFQELPRILSSVYENSIFIPNEYKSGKTSEQSSSTNDPKYIYAKTLQESNSNSNETTRETIVTPSLIQKIALLVHNLFLLAENAVTAGLKECGLVKMFFRLLVIPSVNINNSKEFSLYCDILEMNTAVCTLLAKVVVNQMCLGIILNTRDCLGVMLSLLNPGLYYTAYTQLVYLRNRLWSKIFGLMGALLDSGWKIGDTQLIVSTALNECGHTPFLKTLCEAISSSCSTDLQQSALSSLTSLLRIDNDPISQDCAASISTVLDSIRTPRTAMAIVETESHNEDTPLWAPKNKFDLLENIYFGNVKRNLKKFKDVEQQSEPLMAGAELCRLLLQLYNIACIKSSGNKQNKKKYILINTLTSILCVSKEAKKYALEAGFVETIITQFKELYVKLSLESVDCVRRVGDKKRVCPILKELGNLIGLITNFMLEDENVKHTAAVFGLADLVHKVWVWCRIDRDLLNDALKMLCTYTTDCVSASQSLTLTSPVAGSGPRKSPSTLSLLSEIIALIVKEMDVITHTHSLNILELLLHILHNNCASAECRTVISKSNLLQCISRLHPVITKHQKPWVVVELIWLDFLFTYTGYPEGQNCLAKSTGVLEVVILLTSSNKSNNKKVALLVLRNIAFFQANRPRLLNSDDFIAVLQSKLSNGSLEEKYIVVTIMWALIANCQRAKLVFKSAQLDVKLQECIRRVSLFPDEITEPEYIRKMHFVLAILTDNAEKIDKHMGV